MWAMSHRSQCPSQISSTWHLGEYVILNFKESTQKHRCEHLTSGQLDKHVSQCFITTLFFFSAFHRLIQVRGWRVMREQRRQAAEALKAKVKRIINQRVNKKKIHCPMTNVGCVYVDDQMRKAKVKMIINQLVKKK